ncbi:MAG: flagellar protein FlaG [Planctomycetota bacterium]
MHLDNKLSIDQIQPGRDQRAKTNANAPSELPLASPGTPTERTIAGGPTPSTRAEQQALRREGGEENEGGRNDGARAEAQRQKAERELARMLRLPADTRVQIAVDVAREEVRFQIRERQSGKLLREVPPDEAKPLLEKLEEFSGTLVDRSM